MQRKSEQLTAAGVLLLAFALNTSCPTQGQENKSPYPSMAPLAQYLMADRNAEIALARSAAPKSISDDASVMVLTQHGYETAVNGKNGFACIVERLWTAPFDHPEFWNPKGQSPICYNPAAARSVLLYTFKRTELALAGLTNPQMLDRVKAAVASKELPTPEPGAMSYMLSKDGYLNDKAGHWVPHLMFHIPKADAASWGANLDGSPVVLDDRDREFPEPETIFMVPVGKWSDGTAAPAM